MSALVTPDEMRAAEAAAVAAGRPEPDLMHEAASLIADWLDTHISAPPQRQRVAFAFVGPGNNGGDALVALSLLVERGWIAHAHYLGRTQPGALPVSTDLLSQVKTVDLTALDHADIILDGVYGVGGRAKLPTDIAGAFRNAYDRRVLRGTPLIAIDVPSGVDPGTGEADEDAFTADVTLCLGLPKIGLVREPAASHVGELVMLDIGIPQPAFMHERPTLISEPFVRRALPVRRASAHKHQTGTILVIGGAPTYYGAPRLTAESAARAGAGLICVAIPSPIAPVVAAQVPELVLLPLDDSPQQSVRQVVEWITQRDGKIDACVIGPGLGQSSRATVLLEGLLGDASDGLLTHTRGDQRCRIVLDADALNWIAKRGEFPRSIQPGTAVLTPHVGELSRLTGKPPSDLLRDPIQSARDAAARFEQAVIFKTGFAVVADPGGAVAVAPRAAPELATAGTGDVLAGLVGGLIAQGLELFTASQVAVYVGSHAGRRARSVRGIHGVLARDVIDEIPSVMHRLSSAVTIRDQDGIVREEM